MVDGDVTPDYDDPSVRKLKRKPLHTHAPLVEYNCLICGARFHAATWAWAHTITHRTMLQRIGRW